MNNDIKDLIIARINRDSVKQDGIATVKGITVGVDLSNSCEVTGRPGFVWVKENSQDGAVFQAFNTTIKTLVGLPVIVSRGANKVYRRVITGIDWDVIPGTSYVGEPYTVLNHNETHEWQDTLPGIDAVNVYPRSIAPMRVYPGSGVTISVSRGIYIYNRVVYDFVGEVSYNLLSYVPPSGYNVGIFIYLDFVTGTLQSVVGTPILIAVGEPVYPTILNGVFPLCYVKLFDTTTYISEINIIRDLRPLYSFETGMDSNVAILAAELDMEISRHKVEGL
jgi:hypothetical protein